MEKKRLIKHRLCKNKKSKIVRSKTNENIVPIEALEDSDQVFVLLESESKWQKNIENVLTSVSVISTIFLGIITYNLSVNQFRITERLLKIEEDRAQMEEYQRPIIVNLKSSEIEYVTYQISLSTDELDLPHNNTIIAYKENVPKLELEILSGAIKELEFLTHDETGISININRKFNDQSERLIFGFWESNLVNTSIEIKSTIDGYAIFELSTYDYAIVKVTSMANETKLYLAYIPLSVRGTQFGYELEIESEIVFLDDVEVFSRMGTEDKNLLRMYEAYFEIYNYINK